MSVIVTEARLVGQVKGVLVNIKSTGGSKGRMIISFVVKVQSLVSLITIA